MGKTFRKAKSPLGDFKVTTPKNPLINNQTVISIRNLTTTLTYPKIPTYCWTFASIPNWTWTCSSLLSFNAKISNLWLTLCMDSSTWLTPATWMMLLAAKFFTSSTIKIRKYLVTKPYGICTLHYTTKAWENAYVVGSGPYTWKGCTQRKSKCWLKDPILGPCQWLSWEGSKICPWHNTQAFTKRKIVTF